MTQQSEVTNNPNYIPVLDHGFVGLIDHMGSDASIVQAARVSYGAGTKSVQDDRNLIRYLMRHQHTTPFEMVSVKFHVKLPIFVMRQLVRHRTASINEYSARYSVITDEFYVPNKENIQPQSQTNKQGRAGAINESTQADVQSKMKEVWDFDYAVYDYMINQLGIARETARAVLPVGGYTEMYWTANLKNFLHMAKLRMDSHAQWEIQEFAKAMYALTKPLFPLACEAFEDYIMNAVTLSSEEHKLLLKSIDILRLVEEVNLSKLSKREQTELLAKFKFDNG